MKWYTLDGMFAALIFSFFILFKREWLAAWRLLVALVWLYIETLRLMQKLVIR